MVAPILFSILLPTHKQMYNTGSYVIIIIMYLKLAAFEKLKLTKSISFFLPLFIILRIPNALDIYSSSTKWPSNSSAEGEPHEDFNSNSYLVYFSIHIG